MGVEPAGPCEGEGVAPSPKPPKPPKTDQDSQAFQGDFQELQDHRGMLPRRPRLAIRAVSRDLARRKLVRHVFPLHTIAASPGLRRTAEKPSRYVRGTESTFIQRQRPAPAVFPFPSHKHQLRLPVSYRPDVREFACPIGHSHASGLLQWYHPARQKVAS